MTKKVEELKEQLRIEALELLQSYREAGIKLTQEEEKYYLNAPRQSFNTYAFATRIKTIEELRGES